MSNIKFKTILEDTKFLYWWKPRNKYKIFPKKLNVGDALSPYVVWHTMQTRGPVKPKHKMLAIGSILNHARTGDLIWGTGYNSTKAPSTYVFKDLDVRAVRGPLTKDFLEKRGIEVPEIFGDPGILSSLYFPRASIQDLEYLVIPHMNENKYKFCTSNVLETKGSVTQFMSTIVRAKKVISSSLHGIVIAESFGIPSVLLKNDNGEGDEKYFDYYLGTNRKDFPICQTLEEALSARPCDLPDVCTIQKRLIQAFPSTPAN